MTTPAKPKLLVIEDDAGLQAQLKWAYDDFEIVPATDRESALAALRSEAPAVVTLDLGLPPDPDGTSEGFAVLDAIMALKPDTKVIVASGHGARESVLQAIERGAYDFYHKPVDIEALGLIVQRAFRLHGIESENRQLAQRVGADRTVLGTMITAAPEMLKVARMIERVAQTSVSVMLLGASGTGKELLAKGLHRTSTRSDAPFVAINCAAIPENLLESELFGHEKGAFTGAVKTTEGKIELAHGGTLFLDEVGDIPLALQVKLLRFLQERTIERIGGRKQIAVDTRIVCATHQNLESMIGEGTFREDLFYRLAEIVVKIPSLEERPGDFVLLAKTFLARFAGEMNPRVKGFTPDALAAIDGWGWPGNVRELENRVKRSVIMADAKLVTPEDLDLDDAQQDDGALPLNLKAAREKADRKVIRQALARSEGNISSAAKSLGISRPTLYDLLKQYDLQGADMRLGFASLCAALLALAGCGEAAPEQPTLARAQQALAAGNDAAADKDLRALLAQGRSEAELGPYLGELALARGDLDAARRWLGDGAFAPATAFHGLRMLGLLEMREGNLGEAGTAFDRALRIEPGNADLWVDIARLRYRGGEQLQAIGAVERALGADAGNAAALQFQAQVIRDARGTLAALPYYARALKRDPDNFELRTDYAATLAETGQARAALSEIRSVAAQHPKAARLRFIQAVIAARGGDLALSRTLMARVPEEEMETAAARLLSGILDLELGQHASAAQTLALLAQQQPDNRRVTRLFARALALSDSHRELVDRLRPIVAARHPSPYILATMGQSLEAMGRRDEAAPFLDAAARPSRFALSPLPGLRPMETIRIARIESAAALRDFVRQATVSGDTGAAVIQAARFADRFPGSSDAYNLLGDALLAARDPRAALDAYGKAARIRRDWPLVKRIMAAQMQAGDPNAASRLLEAYLKGGAREAEAATFYAELLAKRGDYARAARLIDSALEYGAGHDPAALVLGSEVAIRQGDETAAYDLARRAYRIQPSYAPAIRAMAAVTDDPTLKGRLNAKLARTRQP